MREKPGPPYDLPDLRPVRAIQNRMRLQGGSVVTGNGQFSSEDFTPGERGWRISGNGDAEFNDVTLRGEIEATEFTGSPVVNTLPDPSFESGLGGWEPIDASSYVVRSTTLARTGSASMRIGGTSTGTQWARRRTPAAPGETFYAAAWVRKPVIATGSNNYMNEVVLNIDFLESGSYIAYNTARTVVSSGSAWELVELYAVAPEGLAVDEVEVSVRHAYATTLDNYLYVDDMVVGRAALLKVPYMVTNEGHEVQRARVVPNEIGFEGPMSNYSFGLRADQFGDRSRLRLAGPTQGFTAPTLDLEYMQDIGSGSSTRASFSVDQVLTGGRVLAPNGTVGNPAYTFDSDADTGLYRVGANQVGIAAGGSLSTSFTANSARFSDGTAAAPGITFQSDTNTGILRPAADTMQFSCGGTVKMALASGTVLMDLAASASAYQPVHRDSTFGTIVRFTSSRRFKDWIETFDGADLVAQLRPVTFYPKEGHGDPSRQSVGFIAEEVADVDTRLTTTGPDGEPDGLDTNAMLAALVAEVQSLRQRVASLEAATA